MADKNDVIPLARRHIVLISVFMLLLHLTSLTVLAQTVSQSLFTEPSQEIVNILDAPILPEVRKAPQGGWVALLGRPPMHSLRELARPRLHLAGYRINPQNNGPSSGGRPAVESIELIEPQSGDRISLKLPAEASTMHHRWSPDGTSLAFSVVGKDAYELWIAEIGKDTPRRIEVSPLNAVSGAPCTWLSDSRRLLCRLVVPGRGEAPSAPLVTNQPKAQYAVGEPTPVRTFQDLLESDHDSDLFEFYFNSQLAVIDVGSSEETLIGEPAIIDRFEPSPNGEYIFVVRTVRPFSFIVPDRWRANDWFPREMEIWNIKGEVVRKIASLPLEEHVAVDDFRSGPRGVMWQPGKEASLIWVENIEGEVPGRRDRVLRLPSPEGSPTEMLALSDRFLEMYWTLDGRGLITEIDRYPRRAASWTRTWLVTSDKGDDPLLIVDRSAEHRYDHPGQPLSDGATLLSDGNWIFLSGDGLSREGEQPFLDRFNLQTLATERLWQSSEGRYEVPVAVLSPSGKRLVIRSEAPDDPPNYYYLDLTTGRREWITDLADPAPQLQDVRRHVLTYEREDGVQLAGVIYTPPGWDGKSRLPTILWAYPREFVSPDAAAQVSQLGNRFTRPTGASHLFLLLAGYAVFDGPSIAILGGASANDTYVEQLVSSTKAAIDAAVESGISDLDRFGVGGHSYGGFMTANLLAHTDLFKAGVSRSAAYNRTLTPFGFQNERRTLWDTPEVYIRMSPFMHADGIDAPMLIIHGEDDANPGTFPVQSERMFHALKGLGKVARLVILPHEDHGYVARESILHSINEMIEWFDRYVKYPARGTTKAASSH